ncbi:Zn-ribbon domain-containing OB-fold protein [Burkholderia lata]|uniref:Zn-ribbon domain-containing OB-fold protein n=1 Tax=Burkholderia lata (strain ATCC 17760 / DSM 23089 / LMG 22485 / NCIMB 9086 / R18194 / 383) TaxID=482957 RepID=UPI0034A0C762
MSNEKTVEPDAGGGQSTPSSRETFVRRASGAFSRRPARAGGVTRIGLARGLQYWGLTVTEIKMEDTVPLPLPVPNADSLPYWEAARAHRLVIRRCTACEALHFMPRHLCPVCWSDRLEWVDSKGTGSVHSFTIVRRAPMAAFTANVPYVVALIDLDEGPRMIANVIGDDALSVRIGDRVGVTFEDRGDGAMLPQFNRIS